MLTSALVVSMTGCDGGPGGEERSVQASAPTGPDRSVCALVIGYSQTRNWFEAMEAGGYVDGDRWELLAFGGAGINVWADPNARYWTEPIASPCAEQPEEPDRLILDIAGNQETAWIDQITRTIENARSRFPSLREVQLQPVVGGPNHQPCSTRVSAVVLASIIHLEIDQAIETLVGGSVRSGADPLVSSCLDYRDELGHLTPEAVERVARTLAEHYGGG